eukprot:CAMPEP_0119325106 /NCGR_PEP_ID=MMETSP1333-20130426/64995_1 /TAXON_ID=418940 /ORGANISM="Scyphosphaera apsteinii, Strain RCC1455" /LENGTH=224 /DNA_ID=CAMNT_0007332993 /DNA_START=126 /DNA_END=800 /DNA_ORIENTATION=-
MSLASSALIFSKAPLTRLQDCSHYYPTAMRSSARADSSWRPETVDPLGRAWGIPERIEKSYSLWLDLRTSKNTFAQMVVVKLFYAVRRVVDEAGKALPKGAAVEGLLFDEARYDRADTIGQDIPIILESPSGLVNATIQDSKHPVCAELRAPTSPEELSAAQSAFEGICDSCVTTARQTDTIDVGGVGVRMKAIALPADPLLWAMAFTGLKPSQLQSLEANQGA